MNAQRLLATFILLGSSAFAWTPGGGWHSNAWIYARLQTNETATLWVAPNSFVLSNAVSCVTGDVTYAVTTSEFYSSISATNLGTVTGVWSFAVSLLSTADCSPFVQIQSRTSVVSMVETTLQVNAADIRAIDTYFAIRERLDMVGLINRTNDLYDASTAIKPGNPSLALYRSEAANLAQYKDILADLVPLFVSPSHRPESNTWYRWAYYTPGTSVVARWHYTNGMEMLDFPINRTPQNFYAWSPISIPNPSGPGSRSGREPAGEVQQNPYDRPNDHLEHLLYRGGLSLDGEAFRAVDLPRQMDVYSWSQTNLAPGSTSDASIHVYGYMVGSNFTEYAYSTNAAATFTNLVATWFDIKPERSWFGSSNAGYAYLATNFYAFPRPSSAQIGQTSSLDDVLNYYPRSGNERTGDYSYTWSIDSNAAPAEYTLTVLSGTSSVHTAESTFTGAPYRVTWTNTVPTGIASNYYESDYGWQHIRSILTNMYVVAWPIAVTQKLGIAWTNVPAGDHPHGLTNNRTPPDWTPESVAALYADRGYGPVSTNVPTLYSDASYQLSFNGRVNAVYYRKVDDTLGETDYADGNADQYTFTDPVTMVSTQMWFLDGAAPFVEHEVDEAHYVVYDLSTNLSATIQFYTGYECFTNFLSGQTNIYDILNDEGPNGDFEIEDPAYYCALPDYLFATPFSVSKPAASNQYAGVYAPTNLLVYDYGIADSVGQVGGSTNDITETHAWFYGRPREGVIRIFPWAILRYSGMAYQ